jgi:hypothetical protein
VEGVQRLLHAMGRAGMVDGSLHVTHAHVMQGSVRTVLDEVAVAAFSGKAGQGRIVSAKLLLAHLMTALVRLNNVQLTAQEPVAAAAGRQQQEGRGVGAAGAAAATAAAEAASAGVSSTTSATDVPQPAAPASHPSGCGCQLVATYKQLAGRQLVVWCPAHSSSPAPPAIDELSSVVDEQQVTLVALTIRDAVDKRARSPLLVGCCHASCNNLDGPSEVGLVANGRGVLCSRCGVARFCSRSCALLAWPAHRHVCGRLAASLGRKAASDGNTTSTATTTSSSSSSSGNLQRKAQLAAAAGSCCDSRQAAAAVPVAAPGTSGSSSADDTVPPKDQRPAAKVRVCAWCGKATPSLLRCAGCKVAWYCGADHQRAAWKAGHKQECAAAAAAAAAPAVSAPAGATARNS